MLWHKVQGAGGVAGDTGPSVVSSDTHVDETDDNQYSFTASLSGSFEHIILCVGARKNSSGTGRIDSATLNGASMVRPNRNDDGRECVAIFILASTDTTPSFVVDMNSNMFYGQFVVLGVTGLTSTTAVDVSNDDNLPFDLDANTVTGGFIVSCHRDRNEDGGTFFTYTNTGIDVDSKVQARGTDGATTVFFEAIATGETPRDIQISSNSTTNNDTSTLASLQ